MPKPQDSLGAAEAFIRSQVKSGPDSTVVVATVIFICLHVSGAAWGADPDILNPGPQLPTFPTNTGTLPQGNVYLEYTPFSYEGGTPGKPGQIEHGQGKFYNQFLAHIGVTDDLEVRAYGSGLTWNEGSPSDTSFAPLSFSGVYKFWGEGKFFPEMPAFAIEASVNTQWLGNSSQNSGTNPGIQLAFSKDIWFDTNLNISMGPMRSLSSPTINGVTTGQYHWDFLFQWALQRDLIENQLAVFAHGYYNGTQSESLPPEDGSQQKPLMSTGKAVIGGGLIWTVTDRFSVFGQISGGINSVSPAIVSWSGFAVAF